jgi:hypothetical protein
VLVKKGKLRPKLLADPSSNQTWQLLFLNRDWSRRLYRSSARRATENPDHQSPEPVDQDFDSLGALVEVVFVRRNPENATLGLRRQSVHDL